MELFGGDFPRPERNYTSHTFPTVFVDRSIDWPDDEPPPRANFDSFGEAVISVFIVLSGENWNDVMAGNAANSLVLACLYFSTLYLFGSLVLYARGTSNTGPVTELPPMLRCLL